MKLSEYIRGYRKNHKMSLREFADKCGCSFQYINKIEKEQINSVSLPMATKLAAGMGLSVHELIDYVDDFMITPYGNDNTLTGKNECVDRIAKKLNQLTLAELAFIEASIDNIIQLRQ